MLETLGISSSHLTYHLENLGELVSKMEDGRYKLSVFGEAAVGTMSRVEEVPKIVEPKRPLSSSMKWKIFFAVIMVGLIVLAGVNYVQIRHLEELNRNNESQLQDLSQTLSSMIYSRYHGDIQAAVQRWIGVHGNPPEGAEVKPAYINTGDVAAWIDPTSNLEFHFRAGDQPSIYGPLYPMGGYWDTQNFPSWIRPPEIIAVMIQLWNISSGPWSHVEWTRSREVGEYAHYLVNTSTHEVVGIDEFYAWALWNDFRDNNLSKTFPEPYYYVGLQSGPHMRNNGTWVFKPLVYEKVNGLRIAYEGVLKIDWNTESVSIETLNPK